jgi:hypothetical protein
MEPVPSARRSGGVQRLVLSSLVAVLVGACSQSPTPTQLGSGSEPGPTAPELAAGTVSGHGITLSAAAEPAVVAPGERIDVEAAVTNDGADPIVLSGSGSGLVFFSVTRLQDGLTSGEPGMTSDCVPHVVPVDDPVIVPFSKSGGWSEDDPNAAFLRTYFSQPELTLPSGTWRVDVTVLANIGQGCTGPPVDLALALVVTVTE